MNQASDMLVIQNLAFFGKKLLFFRKNFKNDNFLNGIKTKQDKIKNSNIVEKYSLFSAPKCDVGNWIFLQLGTFGEIVENFLNFFGFFLDVLWRNLFGGSF